MKQVELISIFKKIEKPYFSFSDLQLILGLGKLSTNKRIIDLVKSGFLLKPAKNIFVPSFYNIDVISIANHLVQPAYLSFESALSFHGVWEKPLDIITFATTEKNQNREIGHKRVMWSRIKRNLFFGFKTESNFMIAEKEKALCDLLYLVSMGKAQLNESDINMTKIDDNKFNEFLESYPQSVIEISRKVLDL